MKKIIFLLFFIVSSLVAKAQWTEIVIPLPFYANSSHFINDSSGFLLAGQGKIYSTLNSGITWDSIETTYNYSWFNTTHFINQDVGYIGGGANFPFPPSSISDLILKTTDGGATWDSIHGTFTGSDILSIDFADENNGIFLSSYISYKTNDGGATIDSLVFSGFQNNYVYG